MKGKNKGDQTERGQSASDIWSLFSGSYRELVPCVTHHLGQDSWIRFMAPEKLTENLLRVLA